MGPVTASVLLLMVLAFPWSDELMLRPNDFHWWQLVTYAFAHGNVWHLLLNGLALASFGSAVERKVGSWNMACVLAVGILAGAITMMELPMAGMSAGIFSVIAFYCGLKPNAKVYLLILPMPAWTVPWVCGVISAVLAITNSMGGIAHLAHLCGLVGGVLCYFQWERVNVCHAD